MAGLSNIFGGGDDFGPDPEEAEGSAAPGSPYADEDGDAPSGDEAEDAGTENLLGHAEGHDGLSDHPSE